MVWGVRAPIHFFFLNIYFLLLLFGCEGLSCGMWDLDSWSRVRSEPPALRTWSFGH